jgi:hypothetical protein
MFHKQQKWIFTTLGILAAFLLVFCLMLSESFLVFFESTTHVPDAVGGQQSRLQGIKTFYRFQDDKVSIVEVKSESSQLNLKPKEKGFEIEESMQGIGIKMEEKQLKGFPKEIKLVKAKDGLFNYSSKSFKANDVELQILYAHEKDEIPTKKGVLAHAGEATFDLSLHPIHFSAKDMMAHVLEKTP